MSLLHVSMVGGALLLDTGKPKLVDLLCAVQRLIGMRLVPLQLSNSPPR